MKTNIDTINAFVEYEQVLEELLNFYNDSVAFNKISFDKGVKTPDSPFWFSVTRFLTYRNFKTIDFSDSNTVDNFIKAFIDYMPVICNKKIFCNFYKKYSKFVLESPERLIRFFTVIHFNEAFFKFFINSYPFLALPINNVSEKDKSLYRKFWSNIIETQDLNPSFYHAYLDVFLSDFDLASLLKSRKIFWKLASSYRNMILTKWRTLK